MGMTERDKKILIGVSIGLVVLVYWFMLLGPKRAALTEAQTANDQAVTTLESAKASVVQGRQEKKTFKASYARVVKLGKALPADDDVASLIVQVSQLAEQDRIDFASLTVAEGGQAPSLPEIGATGATGGGSGAAPVSAVGRAQRQAQGAQDASNADGRRAAGSTADPAEPARPVPTGTDLAAAAAGLEVVTFQLKFSGNFFDLHSFFKRINDLVVRTKRNVRVTGRLLQVTSMKLAVGNFPNLTADVQMTGYKLPKGSSETAGATAAGPAPAAAGAAPPPGSDPAATPPAATAIGGVGR